MSAPPDHAIRYDADVLAALPPARGAAHGWVAAHRDLLGRFLVLVLAVSIAGFGAGCGSTVQDDSQLTVYVSAPTTGEDAAAGKGVLKGAEQALADAGGEAGGAPVTLVALDAADGSTWTQAGLAANAREATQDSTSIAYIGELDSDATRLSVPITNEAGLLQVAPGPVAPDLLVEPGGNDVPADIQTTGERTLGTIFPDLDRVDTNPTVELPFKQLGYESMAVILDSIDRAEDPLSRADVVAAFLATADRPSELGGSYTIAPSGAAVYAN